MDSKTVLRIASRVEAADGRARTASLEATQVAELVAKMLGEKLDLGSRTHMKDDGILTKLKNGKLLKVTWSVA
jgi:hypothetical protein